MSAASIQKKIDAAHKKVGKALGYKYGLYRPLDSNVDVISDRNFIKTVKATVTLNDNYSSSIKWEVPLWTLYTESGELELGDYLFSEELNRTFFVFQKISHQPVYAIEVNDRVSMQVVGYSDSGTGFAPTAATSFAKQLPCYLSYGTGSVSGDLPGNGVGTIPFRTMTVITAMPKKAMVLGETMSDGDGFTGDITHYDYSSVGCGVKITVAERGFPK